MMVLALDVVAFGVAVWLRLRWLLLRWALHAIARVRYGHCGWVRRDRFGWPR